jgi:hypothetical protein
MSLNISHGGMDELHAMHELTLYPQKYVGL